MSKRVLVVMETSWDRPQLEACRSAWAGGYELEFTEPSDHDCVWNLDVVAYVEQQSDRFRGRIDGVFSTSDYPGATVAAAISSRLGLPGSAPLDVLRASHKLASRLAQREAVPEAVPGFAAVDPDDPTTWELALGFPCFLKPVKGAFSMMAGPIASRAALEAFVRSERVAWFRSEYLDIFDRLVRHFGLGQDGRGFVAEELLRGRQVTVEGWRGRAGEGVLGVVDSTFRPGTGSFLRFDYPSDLPAEVQERMGAVALRAAARLGLTDTLFNVELIWNEETGRVWIVEVNPRACGQFADLYQKVDGTSGYELALALSTGTPIAQSRGAGRWRSAASFPLRVFEQARVVRAPSEHEARAKLAAAGDDALVWIECRAGDVLDPRHELEDGSSYRYGVLNLGGADRADLTRREGELRAGLDLELAPAE